MMGNRERLPTEWVNFTIDTNWAMTNVQNTDVSAQKECAGEEEIKAVEDYTTSMVKTSPDSVYASQNATKDKITFKPWYISQYGQEAYEVLKKDKKVLKKAKDAYWHKQNADILKDYRKRYYQQNSEVYERHLAKMREYRLQNSDAIKEYNKQYRQTQIGRAVHLADNYKRLDQKSNRQNSISADWILNNIFNSKCYYCGEANWTKLGCDRIDNSLGHITTNVVCCCADCNVERKTTAFAEFCKKKGIA